MYDKPCNICQHFKKRKTIYRCMAPNNIAEIKHWDTVHVDLPGPYIKSTRQQQQDVTTIKNDASLACMKMIN